MKHTFKRNALLAAVLLAAGTGPVWAAKDAVIAVASTSHPPVLRRQRHAVAGGGQVFLSGAVRLR